jgi:hypothetical protein
MMIRFGVDDGRVPGDQRAPESRLAVGGDCHSAVRPSVLSRRVLIDPRWWGVRTGAEASTAHVVSNVELAAVCVAYGFEAS